MGVIHNVHVAEQDASTLRVKAESPTPDDLHVPVCISIHV